MRGVSKWLIAACAMVVATGSLARADIPPPGAHGVIKRFANLAATLENFSPLSFEGHPAALTSDRVGGVWYGLGNTIQHIDRANRVTSFRLPWDVDGIAYDAHRRLWFSLGQTGRIGTLVGDKLFSRVVVPRHNFPDLREIAFDHHGGLWFIDRGRRSIGRRDANGIVIEQPLRGGQFPIGLAVCGERSFVAAFDQVKGGGEIVSLDVDLHSTTIRTWKEPGRPSVACGRDTKLHFAYASYRNKSFRGTYSSQGIIESVSPVADGEELSSTSDGAILSIGQTFIFTDSNDARRLRIERLGNDRPFTIVLPFDDADTVAQTEDETVWIGISRPHAIVRVRLDCTSNAR